MYSIHSYANMLADRVRMDAYAEALRRTVCPGSVVLDLGAGTGMMALLACRYGARRVFALETEDVIQIAREIAAANSLAEKIEFIQQDSRRVTLPEKADVIVSDIRGALPLFDHHIPAIVDARKRHLAPGGALIPRCDTMWAAVAEAPEFYRRNLDVWEERSLGFQLQPARRIAAQTWRRSGDTPLRLLTEPRCWATLDYTSIEDHNAAGEIEWTAAEAGAAHGLVMWFDTVLADGAGYSNRPGSGGAWIYSTGFFPLEEPVPLEPGDAIRVALRAHLVGEDYLWTWNTTIEDGREKGRVKASFAQSTLQGEFLSPQSLRKGAANFIPELSGEGGVERFILARMDGTASLEEISRALASEFPAQFASWEQALTRVAELSRRFSR